MYCEGNDEIHSNMRKWIANITLVEGKSCLLEKYLNLKVAFASANICKANNE